MSIELPNRSRSALRFSAFRSLASGFCIFALALLMAGAASAAIQSYTADTATLHLWHFDETSAPCVDSVAGGTNLAFLIGGVNVGSAGLSNNAVNFKKALNFGTLTTSNAIAMPAGSGNVGTASPFTFAGSDGAFTFEALLQINFNPTNFVRAQPCQILNCDANGTGTRVFQFRLLPVGFAGGGGDTNFVRIEFINGTTTAAVAPIPRNGPDVIESNQWYHLAITFNGVANTASNFLFYWTLLDTNRATANLIYATNLASDLPGISSATTIFSVGNGARNPGGGSGPAVANFLGSIDEVRISSVARAANEFVFQNISVTASATQSPNNPTNSLDGSLATRWSAQGDGQYITYDLGRVSLVQSVDLAFYQPSTIRTNWFDLQLSCDGVAWRQMLTNTAGTNAALANFDFPDWPARYVRIVGHMNSANDFNSIVETVIHYSVPPDTDNDGLPDAWESFYFGNLTNAPDGDPDGDGQSNAYEFIHGTDPLSAPSYPEWLSPTVAFLRDSVVATNACLMPNGSTYGRAINGISFQKQILLTLGGYQYTAWYDTVGTNQLIWLARRTVTNTSVGAWEKFQTDSEFLNGDESAWDAHDVIAFGICPQDGTLHIAWDHHNNTLRYRRSVVGLCTTNKAAWGSGMLNAEQNWLVVAGQTELDVTYPQFIATPDGGLVLDRRMGVSGNGDQYFQFYNPASGAWSAKVQFINRAGTYVGPDPFGTTRTCTERCAYLNGFDFGPDGKIHVTWTWRESASQYGNRDICYAYSPDMGTNWYNNAGTKIADTSLGQTITQGSSGIAVMPLDMRQLLINQQAQCVDNDGRVHVLMLHRRQEAGYEPAVFSKQFSTKFTAYYHYFRDPTTGVWTQRQIPPDVCPVGSRPKIVYDTKGNVYAAYLSYPAGTDVVPGYTSGKLVVASASKASQYTDWQVVQALNTTFNGEPLIDQARLLSDNILSVYIQENSATTTVVGTPLHVFDFAIGVTPPNALSLNFISQDSLVTLNSAVGHNYQLQATPTLSPVNWTNASPVTAGVNALLTLPDANGRSAGQRFYRVVTDP